MWQHWCCSLTPGVPVSLTQVLLTGLHPLDESIGRKWEMTYPIKQLGGLWMSGTITGILHGVPNNNYCWQQEYLGSKTSSLVFQCSYLLASRGWTYRYKEWMCDLAKLTYVQDRIRQSQTSKYFSKQPGQFIFFTHSNFLSVMFKIYPCALTHFPCTAGDTVYLSDEKERQEYVMNENGVIFRGSGNYISPLNWDFGQVKAHKFVQLSWDKTLHFVWPFGMILQI